MDNQQQMLWMDEDFTAPAKPLTWEEKAAQAEEELQQFNVSYKPQKISPKIEGSVSGCTHACMHG